jgi:hypothetical protein
MSCDVATGWITRSGSASCPWRSARLLRNAVRAWLRLPLGAALSGSARRRTAQGEAGTHSGERFGVCALVPAARAPLRW